MFRIFKNALNALKSFLQRTTPRTVPRENLAIMIALEYLRLANGFQLLEEVNRRQKEAGERVFSSGTIYAALGQLVSQGDVVEEIDPKIKKGPKRKLYRLTDQGRSAKAALEKQIHHEVSGLLPA